MMNVLFYDQDKHTIKYRLGRPYRHGGCGSVYRLDKDTCLKWFSEGDNYDASAFETIMRLALPGFYQIYKMLYDENNHFCGYTMKYYDAEDFDILTTPTEYTAYNLHMLYSSIDTITKNSIFASDLRQSNVIMNKNSMTIIDVDLYFRNMYYSIDDALTKNDIINYNINALYSTFAEIYFNALADYHYPMAFDKRIIDELFDPALSPSEITKKLVRYKYPMDYIKEHR